VTKIQASKPKRRDAGEEIEWRRSQGEEQKG
jgi:hypothetical protein